MIQGLTISNWLNDYIENANLKAFVVGISGGIDSALTSTLCSMTGKKTIVVSMPIYQNPKELERANHHIKWLEEKYTNVEKIEVDLTETFEHFKNKHTNKQILTEKNSIEFKHSGRNTNFRTNLQDL